MRLEGTTKTRKSFLLVVFLFLITFGFMASKAVAISLDETLPSDTLFILDADMDVDDFGAMTMMIAKHPNQILGITVANGCAYVSSGAINALRFLCDIGRLDIPIYIGLNESLTSPNLTFPIAWRNNAIEYADRYGFPPLSSCNVSNPKFGSAVDFISDSVRTYSDRIVFVCTGPLTNIAAAIMESNFSMSFPTVRGLVFEGGGVFTPERDGTPGNYSDWNTFADPVATAIVLSSLSDSISNRSKAYMMGSDITSHTPITPEFHQRVHLAKPGSPEGSVLQRGIEIVAKWRDPFLYDFVTSSLIIRPELFFVKTVPVEVVVIGPESGRTMFDPYNGSPTNVVLGFANNTLNNRRAQEDVTTSTSTSLSMSTPHLSLPPAPSRFYDMLLQVIVGQ